MVRNVFRSISDVTEHIRQEPDGSLIAVSVTPFFAETWLVPRLSDLHQRFPDTDLQVIATTAISNLEAGGADVAIRHGLGRHPGMSADLIVAPSVTPVEAIAPISSHRSSPGISSSTLRSASCFILTPNCFSGSVMLRSTTQAMALQSPAITKMDAPEDSRIGASLASRSSM